MSFVPLPEFSAEFETPMALRASRRVHGSAVPFLRDGRTLSKF